MTTKVCLSTFLFPPCLALASSVVSMELWSPHKMAEIINLEACYINISVGMERKKMRLRWQARYCSECGVVMISLYSNHS